jgi:hypothetical protein
MLKWISKNKDWLFQGAGLTISTAVGGVFIALWSSLTVEASGSEKQILVILMILSVIIVGMAFFLGYIAIASQTHPDKAELAMQLASIEKKLKSIETPRRFDDWDQVQPEIQRLIKNSFEDFEYTELSCLGVALHVSWKTVRECIEQYHKKYNKYPKASIHLKVLCLEWPNWDKFGRAWERRNRSFYESVYEFTQKTQGSDLKIITYDYNYVPNWHGVLIKKRHLFRSSCLYRNDEFTVHKNPYVYFQLEENEYSDMQVSEFEHWFSYESRNRTLEDLKKIVKAT